MKAIESTGERPARVLVVDAVRGLAVVCMIQWHCADAWLGGSIREGDAFVWLRIVGGLAAPLFFLLAGVASGLTFRPSTLAASIRRALTIVVMGYALKLFAWVVDHGAILERRNWAAITLEGAAIGLAWHGLSDGRTKRERWIALPLAVLSAIGMGFARGGTTRAPDVAVRLDVLQGIGAALVLTLGVLWLVDHLTRRDDYLRRALVVGAVGLVVALATPSFFGMDLSFVPARLLDYVARTTSVWADSGARFSIFPWAGYSLVGAALGLAARARPSQDAWAVPFARRPILLFGLSLGLAFVVYEPSRTAQWLLTFGETPRNVLRLFFNTAVAVAMGAASALTLPRAKRLADALLLLGRHSLIVYCVHLELAYGLVAIPIHEQLGFAWYALGLAAVIALMLLLSFGLDRRPRSGARPRTRRL